MYPKIETVEFMEKNRSFLLALLSKEIGNYVPLEFPADNPRLVEVCEGVCKPFL